MALLSLLLLLLENVNPVTGIIYIPTKHRRPRLLNTAAQRPYFPPCTVKTEAFNALVLFRA